MRCDERDYLREFEGTRRDEWECDAVNVGWTPSIEIEEAMRWCFRHGATVEFYRAEGGHYVRVSTPLRVRTGPKKYDRAVAKVHGHDKSAEAFTQLVTETRERLGYE